MSLLEAARTGNVEAIRHHVAAGSDLDEKELGGGSGPLIIAATFGQPEAAQALIDAGADLNLRNNDGSTALITAAFLGRTEIVESLLAAGADADLRNNAGSTALGSVEAPFEAVRGIYDVVGAALGPLGLKLDYEAIQAERPHIAQLLREASGRAAGASSTAASLEISAAQISSVSSVPAVTPEDWPTYNYDSAGWRFNPAEKTLGPDNVGGLVEKWRFPSADSKETIGVVHATPAVVDGEVYFGTATFPAFHKLSRDGEVRWVYRNPAHKTLPPPARDAAVDAKLGAAASESGILSSPLVAAGAVYSSPTPAGGSTASTQRLARSAGKSARARRSFRMPTGSMC